MLNKPIKFGFFFVFQVMQHLLNIHTDYWFSFISEDIAILSEPNAEILTSEI